MEIGSKIKRLRVRLGLTQEELAARNLQPINDPQIQKAVEELLKKMN